MLVLLFRLFQHRVLPHLVIKAVAVSLLLITAGVEAQESAPEPPAKKPADIRMVIDISGSMRKNDPMNLRQPALDMLVKLIPEGSKAGVWTFGQYVNMLVPHKELDAGWAKEASNAAEQIRSIAQFTNIGGALEKAAYDHKNPDTSQDTHILLLTDGMVDINRDPEVNTKERLRIIEELIPLYQLAGYTIHTIALSDNADSQLLTKMALATDGVASIAKTADELMNAFLQVFNQAVPAEELPFNGESFVTDSSVEEFTALIFRQPGSNPAQLIAPDGERYDKDSQNERINWHHTEQYDLATIKQPLEGEWRVLAEVAPQSRVTVVSDLSLAVADMPTNIAVGDVVDVSLVLREENKTVTRPEFLQLLDIDLKLHYQGEEISRQRLSNIDALPEDGVYRGSADLFSKEGQYILSLMVDGKTFRRQYSHNLSVRDPFAISLESKERQGNTQFTVDVIPQVQTINLQETQVKGVLTDPLGEQMAVAFDATLDGNWRLKIESPQKGEYRLQTEVLAKHTSGETKTIRLEEQRWINGADNIDDVPKPEAQTSVPQAEAIPVETQLPEPVAELVEETAQPEEAQEPEKDYFDWILYAGLGLVNLLIIGVIFVIFRKLFASKPKQAGEGEESDETQPKEDELGEPPMDEMAIDDLDEPPEEEEEIPTVTETIEEPAADMESEDIMEDSSTEPDQAPDSDLDPAIDLDDSSADDALSEIIEEETDTNSGDIDLDSEMDDPNFSLDEFDPESLDDEDDK